jgi:hypothetical protein
MLRNDQSFPLMTPAILVSGGDQVPLFSHCTEERPGKYSFTVRDAKGNGLGRILILVTDKDGHSFNELKPDELVKAKRHVYVILRENYDSKTYKHVGYALQECAIRASVELGAEGRIINEGAWSAHYFHFKNGFRLTYPSPEQIFEYYLSLGNEVLEANGGKVVSKIGGKSLLLPSEQIQKDLARFSLPSVNLEPTDDHTKKMYSLGEKIVREGEKHNPALRMLLALNQGTEKNPSASASASKRARLLAFMVSSTNPEVKKIITHGLTSLVDLFPIDSEEKQRVFDQRLVGILVLATTAHDKFAGGHSYPGLAHQDLLRDNWDDAFTQAGESVLVRKTIPFVMPPFPQLLETKEFKDFCERHHLATAAPAPSVSVENIGLFHHAKEAPKTSEQEATQKPTLPSGPGKEKH